MGPHRGGPSTVALLALPNQTCPRIRRRVLAIGQQSTEPNCARQQAGGASPPERGASGTRPSVPDTLRGGHHGREDSHQRPGTRGRLATMQFRDDGTQRPWEMGTIKVWLRGGCPRVFRTPKCDRGRTMPCLIYPPALKQPLGHRACARCRMLIYFKFFCMVFLEILSPPHKLWPPPNAEERPAA